MSNKSILQNHNNRLNINNIDLSSILNTINRLPVSGQVQITEHYLEGTNLNIILSNGQTLIVDLSVYNTIVTINDIEQYIVFDLEGKSIKEVGI